MKKAFRIFSIILVLTLCLTAFAACGKDDSATNNPDDGGTSLPPAEELETFTMPYHPCMKFSYPKYAYDTGYSVEGRNSDCMYVEDIVDTTYDELMAMDEETRNAALRTDYSMNNLTGYTITDLSSSTRTNAKGVSIYTYECEATVSGSTLYLCFYVFDGIESEEEGWVLGYTSLHDKSKSDQTLLQTVFDTIEVFEVSDEA